MKRFALAAYDPNVLIFFPPDWMSRCVQMFFFVFSIHCFTLHWWMATKLTANLEQREIIRVVSVSSLKLCCWINLYTGVQYSKYSTSGNVFCFFFTLLTDRASTIPSTIRGCQSGTWSAGQKEIRGASTKLQREQKKNTKTQKKVPGTVYLVQYSTLPRIWFSLCCNVFVFIQDAIERV